MQDLITRGGVLVEYNILPVDIKIHFTIFRNKSSFDEVVKDYDGVLLERKEDLLITDSDFVKDFPLFDFSDKTNCFQLSNGSLAIDQSYTKKSNPYFICSSYEEYKLINQYLNIYFIDESKEPVIECVLFSHQLIKNFLREESLQLFVANNEKGYKIFHANSDKVALLKFSVIDSSNFFNTIFFESLDDSESEYYHSLTIYESLEIMQLLGVCEFDSSAVQGRSIKECEKYIFIKPDDSIPVKIVSRSSILNSISRRKGWKNNKFREGFSKDFIQNEGKIMSPYTFDIYLQFYSKHDFDIFLKLAVDSANADNNVNTITDFKSEMEKVTKELRNGELRDWLLDVTIENKTLEQVLSHIEKKFNKFFFDRSFTNLYFPKLAAFIGFVVEKKYGGSWVYDEKLMRYVIQLSDNNKLDFIPDLYEEMLKQKYTGFCPIKSIIEGLITGSNLRVVK